MRGSAEIRWEKGMPPLVNDRNVIEELRTAAEKTIGADHVITVQNPSLGSEDFSFLFPLLAPGAQFRLGSGNDVDPNTRHGLHNSKNIFDDSCIGGRDSRSRPVYKRLFKITKELTMEKKKKFQIPTTCALLSCL